jgi:PAS domain-containing protein
VETIDLEGERCILSLLRDVTEEQRTERIRNAIYEISEATSSAKDLQGLFGIIHRSVWELLPSRNFCIELYDPSTDLLSFPYFFDEQEPNPEPYHPGRSLTEYVLQTVLPFLFTPKSFEAMVERGEVEAMGAPGMDWLGVPLTVGSQTIGVLAVQSYTEGTRFTPGDRDILSLMSSQVAIAVERKRGQDALQRTESRFRAVFKRSPIGIALSDLDGRVVESNPALQAMLGCTSEEMRGMSMRDLTHPDDLSRNLDLFGDFDRGARRRTRSWSGMSARIGGCSGGAFPSPFRNPRRLSRHMWSGWWKTSPRNETPSPGRDQHSPSSCPGSTSTDPS